MSSNQAVLRFGVDGDALKIPLTGVGHYVLELCRELEKLLPNAQFFVYSRLTSARLILPSSRWQLRSDPRSALRRLPSFLWLRTRGSWLCRQDSLDVFWGCRGILPNVQGIAINMVTVHDLTHWVVPETMQLSTLWSHKLWFDQSVRRSEILFANSRGTADRVQNILKKTSDAIVEPGLSSRFKPLTSNEERAAFKALSKFGIRHPYLISVATLEPRKNVEAVFEAFVELKASGRLPATQQLVLVGVKGWSNPSLERKLRNAASDGVLTLGYVADEWMPLLYACADALVCPSRYEGFGMPVLEARACGTRVVISDVPELIQAGGRAATVCSPTVKGVTEGVMAALALPRVTEPLLLAECSWRLRAETMINALQRHGSA